MCSTGCQSSAVLLADNSAESGTAAKQRVNGCLFFRRYTADSFSLYPKGHKDKQRK